VSQIDALYPQPKEQQDLLVSPWAARQSSVRFRRRRYSPDGRRCKERGQCHCVCCSCSLWLFAVAAARNARGTSSVSRAVLY